MFGIDDAALAAVGTLAAGAGSVGSAVGSVVGNVLGYQGQHEANNINKNVALYNAYMQQQNFDYQRALQNTIFEREDNAISRQVADLERNGLNKQLIAGGGAGAGAVVSASAPQVDYKHQAYNPSIELGNGLLQLGDYILRAKMTQEQINNIRADTNNKNISGTYTALKTETEKLNQLKIEQEIINQKNENSLMAQKMASLVEEQEKKVKLLDAQLTDQSLQNNIKAAELQDIEDYRTIGLTSKGKSKSEGVAYISKGIQKIPLIGPLADFIIQSGAHAEASLKTRKRRK